MSALADPAWPSEHRYRVCSELWHPGSYEPPFALGEARWSMGRGWRYAVDHPLRDVEPGWRDGEHRPATGGTVPLEAFHRCWRD